MSSLLKLLTFSLLGWLWLATSPAQAQGPGPAEPSPGGPSPTAVPLDGGSALLVVGGVAYGLRRLRRRHQ